MKKWFRNLKLQSKFFVILLLALLVVFSGVLLTSRMTQRAYNDALYERTVQLLTLFAQNVQSELDAATDTSFTILADNVLQASLSQMRRHPVGSAVWMNARQMISDRFVNMTISRSNIVALRLRARDGTYFSRSTTGAGIPFTLFIDHAQAAHDAQGGEIWIPDADYPDSVFLLRDIREVEDLTLEPIATLALRVSMARLVSRCVKPLAEMDMPLLCAIDLKGTRVFSGDDRIAHLSMHAGRFTLEKLDGETFFCVRYAPSGSDWAYTAALPYDGILHSLRHTASLSTAIAAGALVLALVLGSLLISSIVLHFKRLIAKYNAFARGEKQTAAELALYRDRQDEIGELHRQFDQMAAEHQRMIEEIYVKQQLLLEAQVRQLRAQIQPHFLYNTLESISCLAESCADTRIATISTALGHMLRATLKDKRDMIALRDDMSITQEYLSIQQIRYADQLRAQFLIDDEYLDVLIPSMTLQPLVENAVRHGAEEMLDVCEIRIYAQRAGRYIDLTVEDNGPGIEEDILEKLQSGALKPDGLGIGLSNIHQRLRLAFQDEGCGLRFRREDGKTHVIVRILAEVKKDDQAASGR